MQTFNIRITFSDPEELTPEEIARMEFYTRERRLEFGEFLFAEIQKIQQQKGKDNVNKGK